MVVCNWAQLGAEGRKDQQHLRASVLLHPLGAHVGSPSMESRDPRTARPQTISLLSTSGQTSPPGFAAGENEAQAMAEVDFGPKRAAPGRT